MWLLIWALQMKTTWPVIKLLFFHYVLRNNKEETKQFEQWWDPLCMEFKCSMKEINMKCFLSCLPSFVSARAQESCVMCHVSSYPKPDPFLFLSNSQHSADIVLLLHFVSWRKCEDNQIRKNPKGVIVVSRGSMGLSPKGLSLHLSPTCWRALDKADVLSLEWWSFSGYFLRI